jgi:hypothetical protein
LVVGTDEIGVQIEEPFGILPLEDVCVDIQAEIDAMMERQDIVTGQREEVNGQLCRSLLLSDWSRSCISRAACHDRSPAGPNVMTGHQPGGMS